MGSPLDLAPLEEAKEHVKYMQWFVKEVKGQDIGEEATVEQAKVAEVLEWFLNLGKDHVKNLRHVYNIGSKKVS